MFSFSELMMAKKKQCIPPTCIRAALWGRCRCFMQCRSGTGTESWRGCAIAVVVQNTPGQNPKMQDYPCFERGLGPQETS